jgi:hypothetical protein
MVSGRNGHYVLSKRIYRMMLHWLEKERLVCEMCGEEILPGCEIHRCGKVTVRPNQYAERQGNPLCRLYHDECWESLYFEC